MSLEVENLQARLNVDTRVASLVQVNAGVVATVQKLKVDLEGVVAETHLIVRLDRVAGVMERALATINRHPNLAGSPIPAAPAAAPPARPARPWRPTQPPAHRNTRFTQRSVAMTLVELALTLVLAADPAGATSTAAASQRGPSRRERSRGGRGSGRAGSGGRGTNRARARLRSARAPGPDDPVPAGTSAPAFDASPQIAAGAGANAGGNAGANAGAFAGAAPDPAAAGSADAPGPREARPARPVEFKQTARELSRAEGDPDVLLDAGASIDLIEFVVRNVRAMSRSTPRWETSSS